MDWERKDAKVYGWGKKKVAKVYGLGIKEC